MQFGQLTALFQVDKENWAFLCSCGQTTIAKASHVRREKGTMSCGCHKAVNGGRTDTPEWKQWHNSYSHLWLEFQDFWLELGPRPDPSMP